MKYRVRVRRYTSEDIEIMIEASSADEARKQAELKAINNLDGWEIYNCDYYSDEPMKIEENNYGN